MLLLFCSGAAPAFGQPALASLELLGPSGLVPPDGFEVAVVRREGAGTPGNAAGATVRADGAEVRPGPAAPVRSFTVTPNPGVREVRVRAEQGGQRAERVFKVGPPGARVALTLEPALPVKGKDTVATLRVRLSREDGTPDPDSAPPVLRANVGTLEALERVGAGEFKARYLLPTTRYPEVAVIVALSAWPHPASVHGTFGHILVPLATAIELPGRTEPNAKMQLEIAGVTYGPVPADAEGRFKLPVVVPPGHRYARGVAEDRAGNRRRTRIDLMLPPTDQLACVHNPTRVFADGEAKVRILCASSDPFGKPARGARVALRAARGQLSAQREAEEGVLEWIYTAPQEVLGADTLSASARLPSGTSSEELKLELVQGPVEKVLLGASHSTVHRGATAPFLAELRDAFGKPRPSVVPKVSASEGSVEQLSPAGEGFFRGALRVPEQGAADVKLTLRAQAVGPFGSLPSELRTWTAGGKLLAAFVDPAGWPVPRQPLLVGDDELSTGEGAVVELPLPQAPTVLRHRDWAGLARTLYPVREAGLWPQTRPLALPAAELALRVAPPVPVNVRLELRGGQASWWVEDAEGKRLAGRRVEVTLPGAPPREVLSPRERITERVPQGAEGALTVVDLQTGVMAIAEVRR